MEGGIELGAPSLRTGNQAWARPTISLCTQGRRRSYQALDKTLSRVVRPIGWNSCMTGSLTRITIACLHRTLLLITRRHPTIDYQERLDGSCHVRSSGYLAKPARRVLSLLGSSRVSGKVSVRDQDRLGFGLARLRLPVCIYRIEARIYKITGLRSMWQCSKYNIGNHLRSCPC